MAVLLVKIHKQNKTVKSKHTKKAGSLTALSESSNCCSSKCLFNDNQTSLAEKDE